jgi:pyruvate/2-oxoglutarate dehydrogenase complex dihydrolipoamide acyltransferase (E2) component
MSATDVISVEVPDIGDFEDVPVIEILVSPGDTVAVDDPLLTLESDKATMDVPAPFAGTVGELQVKIGDRVSQGVPLLTLMPSGEAPSGSKAAAAADQGAPTEAAAPDAVASATEAEAQAGAERTPAPAPPPATPA